VIDRLRRLFRRRGGTMPARRPCPDEQVVVLSAGDPVTEAGRAWMDGRLSSAEYFAMARRSAGARRF
jgi:hypothetical protein